MNESSKPTPPWAHLLADTVPVDSWVELPTGTDGAVEWASGPWLVDRHPADGLYSVSYNQGDICISIVGYDLVSIFARVTRMAEAAT